MNEPDTKRLQNDLDMLRSVVGSELPFDGSDVQGLLLTGGAAFVPAIVHMAGIRACGTAGHIAGLRVCTRCVSDA